MKRPKAFAVGKVRVRVHSGPDADGRWRWRADRAAGVRTVDGRRVEHRETVWSGWATRDDAEQQVIQALAGRGERFIGPEDIRTVYDLLDVFVADYEGRARNERTAKHRRASAERLGRSELGPVVLSQLVRRSVERYRDASGHAPSTIREDLTTLRMAWNWGRERQVVPDRDLPTVEHRVTRKDAVYCKHTPTIGEIAAVLYYMAPRWPWAYRMVRLLFATGARRHEIASLRWDQVDLEAGIIRIGDATKTGARVVALHADVVTEIARWPRETELVHGAAESTAAHTINDRLMLACRALGVTRWTAKGLRQAAVRQLYRSGADPGEAGAQLGHSPQIALRHYDEVRAEDLVEAVKRASLGVLPEGPPRTDNVLPFGARKGRK